jgi:hypothetical protein
LKDELAKMELLHKDLVGHGSEEKTELIMRDVRNIYMKIFQNIKEEEIVDVDIFEKVRKAKEFQKMLSSKHMI